MNPKQVLPGLRIAIGLGAFAAPELTGKIFGLNTKDNHDAVFLGRLFGIRDVALGIGQTLATGEGSGLWWQLGVICDLADSAAAVMMMKAGGPKRASLMAAVTGATAAGLGLAALNAPSE
jgi:hypothetical protein